MNDKYLKIIETLGEVIINKDLSNSVLKYENEQLKAKLEAVEQYVNYYEIDCEKLNKKMLQKEN